MAGAGAVFAAGHGDIDRMVLHLGDAEGRAHGHDAEATAERGFDLTRTQAVDLDVDLADGQAQQRIAHATTDQQRTATGRA